MGIRMRVRSLAVAVSLLSLCGVEGAGAAAAAPAGLGPCAERGRVAVFHEGGIPLVDWRENLEFDGRGTLWVAHVTQNRVEGYAPDGSLRASFAVSGPGGIRRGPDGMMYVNFGVNPLSPSGGIARFDPAAAHPEPETVVDGLSGVNGLAVDGRGNFYVSRELATGVLKFGPDGTPDTEWTKKADVFGTNGLQIVGDQLYASVITSTESPVVRIPLDDPARHSVVTRLSAHPLDVKLLDDLTEFEGDLVVATFGSGELIRVDPATGRSCVLVSGLRMPTSVRVPRGFGDHDGRRELYVVEASGRILKVTVG
ncbi:SMP-30/gluconolactonase/LRE family protein [Streptomyces sp. NPDC059009]|uniref:SMP-30/gluconolactonase/LRE family protein n=1 Tax=Streptomyces sp. NPDC059009 TaxID=3346694 RepID=UPI00369368C3